MEKIFKAKRIDNGEWIYSDSLDFLDSDDYVLMGKKDAIYGVVWHKCDKNTICQYTGINDSEGNLIFDGDYCDCEIYRNENSMKTEKHNGFVVFNEFEYCLEMESHFFPVASWKIIHSAKLTGHNIHDRCE